MKLLPLLVIILAIMLGVVFYILSFSPEDQTNEAEHSTFSVLEMGRAGGSGYAIFNHRGDTEVTLITHNKKPSRKITIINDSDGMEMESFPELVELVSNLEEYGFEVEVTDDKVLRDGIFVIPTGAIPSYVYDDLAYNATNSTILFIGQKNLIIQRGVKKSEWYNSLSQTQKDRIVIYETTLDELMKNQTNSLSNNILESSWSMESKQESFFKDQGVKTITTNMRNSSYLRLIYHYPNGKSVIDSAEISVIGKNLDLMPQSIYPWERSTLSFDLNKTNGTAYLSVSKDGEKVENQELRRVTDSNYFLKRFQFEDPGEYVISVRDNTGVIASTILHIKDLQITHLQSNGVTHIFNVTVDGKPLDRGEVVISLADSEVKKEYYIDDGLLAIGISGSALNEGENTLNADIFGTTMPITFQYSGSSLLQFYVTYGVPSLALIIFVYFIGRISRRPRYMVRFSDLATDIRKDVSLSSKDALTALGKIREEMQLGKSPITTHEFSIALKRFVTNGADVTAGNVDEILSKLSIAGSIDTHRGYYQLRGEGDVKRNTLLRMIREKLIENGIKFSALKDKFVTKDYEIGFFGNNFKKKALLIVDNDREIEKITSSLDGKARAALRIKQSNGMINFVPISKLGEYL